jgi:hypothetical protein
MKDLILIDEINILEVKAWMDGGTVTIICSNSKGIEFTIEFQQHTILISSPEGKMPGRIYLNKKLVEERSEIEKRILYILKKSIIEGKDKLLIQEKIDYIQSSEYLKNNKEVENLRSQLIGREFDWFGADSNGKFGIFSSAGSGIIPMNVIEDFKSHDIISEQIELLNFGTEMVWNDFASYGLFVYDWSQNNGPYIKKSNPNSEISEKLKSKLSNLRSLVEFKVSFADSKEIMIE